MNRYLGAMTDEYASALSRRQFLLIVGLFWAYVAVSNVLYAYGMRTGIAQMTNVPLFAPWDARVLQHVFLLPLILVSYWASLRIEWRPVLVALPLQVVLALAFAALAYPALELGELMAADHLWHAQIAEHQHNPFADPMTGSLWLASFVSFLPTYGFGLALVTGSALYTRFRNSELQRAALEREWSAARLAALRMQLSPHTLFNLLHTIRGLIEWDPKAAQSMVVQLADLLRRLLNAGERDYSRLADELEFVRLYLELQQRRFTDRLQVIMPAAQDVVDAWVPSLILQPLVENAVVHGLAGHQGAVTVRVSVRREGDSLALRVINTVAPHKSAGPPGIGISNVRERLAVQFEGRAGLVAGASGAEWVAEITLPEIHASLERRGARRGAALAPA
ncbi:MAG TPA: histidine kinase [Steroidobacteraceae bacterium]|nr:histidine kinase [Steroidobacteraceae bacterium]